MTNVDVVGCRRRSAYDFQKQLGKKMDFRCKGREGPPCFLKLGDTADFRATFQTGIDKYRDTGLFLQLIQSEKDDNKEYC